MGTLWTFGDSFTAGDGCVEKIPIRDGDFKYYNKYNKNKLEIETILNYGVLFCQNSLFQERQNKRFRFIETLLKLNVKKILIWDIDSDLRKSIETISRHTKGKIKDYHFSFSGHKEFSELLYKKLYTKDIKLTLI